MQSATAQRRQAVTSPKPDAKAQSFRTQEHSREAEARLRIQVSSSYVSPPSKVTNPLWSAPHTHPSPLCRAGPSGLTAVCEQEEGRSGGVGVTEGHNLNHLPGGLGACYFGEDSAALQPQDLVAELSPGAPARPAGKMLMGGPTPRVAGQRGEQRTGSSHLRPPPLEGTLQWQV